MCFSKKSFSTNIRFSLWTGCDGIGNTVALITRLSFHEVFTLFAERRRMALPKSVRTIARLFGNCPLWLPAGDRLRIRPARGHGIVNIRNDAEPCETGDAFTGHPQGISCTAPSFMVAQAAVCHGRSKFQTALCSGRGPQDRFEQDSGIENVCGHQRMFLR